MFLAVHNPWPGLWCLTSKIIVMRQFRLSFVLVLFVLTLAPLFTQAQDSFKGLPFVEVTGVADIEIEPNEIFVMIRLKEFEENKQKTSLEKLEKDFFNALKEAGIDRKRVELMDAGSSLEKIGKRDKDSFREKTYQIKLTSAGELEKFIAKLEPVKVASADVIRLHHSDYDKIKMELKTKALLAARAKADGLVKAVGSELGKPLVIRDFDVELYQPMMEMKANVRMQGGDFDQAAPEPPVAFRKIKLQAQISAQFEIK